MKKIIALLLAVILCMTLCACGKTLKDDAETITAELNGSTWMNKGYDDENYAKWTFDYGLVEVETTSFGISLKPDKGKFNVQDGLILLTWDEVDCGRVKELYYTVENNQLKLYTDANKEYELERIENNEGNDKSELSSTTTTNKSTYNTISQEKATAIAEQEIINMCCDRSNVSTISIDFGTFTVSKTSIGDYKFKAKGTYLPKDNYGMYGSRMKFDIELYIDKYTGKVFDDLGRYSSAY